MKRLISLALGLLLAAQAGAVVKNQPPGAGGGGGSGTVTSVDASAVAPLCVSGGPITITGTLTFTWCGAQTANQFLATPDGSTGAASLRSIVVADLPTVNGNVGSFTYGSFTVNAEGLITAASNGSAPAAAANPTGIIGLTAVNGVATTYPRSDSAPALSQAIVPTWTGLHTWNFTGQTANTMVNSIFSENTTTASAGNQQEMCHHLEGQGWGTTAPASVPVDWELCVVPIQGATATSNFTLYSSINGSGYTAAETLASNGAVTFGGQLFTTGNATVPNNSSLAFQSGMFLSGGTAGQLVLGSGTSSATPVNATLAAPNSIGGTSSNVAGANLTVRSGNGTGNAAGSTLSLQVPLATTSGTTQQVATTELSLSTTAIALGDATNKPATTLNGATVLLPGIGTGAGSGSLCYGAGNTVTTSTTACTGASGGAPAFSALTSGTNTAMAGVVGTGASLAVSGTGTIAATSVTGLSVVSGKTLTANNSLTLAGTDATTFTFPATTGTVDVLNNAQTFTAVKTFTNSDIALLGSSTGATTFTSANAGASNFTLTFPAATDTVATLAAAQALTNKTYNGNTFTAGTGVLTLAAGKTLTDNNSLTLAGTDGTTMTFPATTGTVDVLNNAQTFTAVKTFTNSDLALLGSSTGATTFTSANAGASNFTLTFPAATDTVATLAATQTLTNKSIAASEVNSGTLAAAQMPAMTGDATSTSGTVALTVAKINGTALSGLATGILKNTTATGVPSIAIAADFPTLNQSTSGNAATATALASAPTLCSTGQAPTGVLASGNATGCAAIGGAPAFGSITTGSNTTATMTVGTGGTLTVAGTGVNNANQLNGAIVPASAALLASNSSGQETAITLGNNLAISSATLQTTQLINPQTGTTYAIVAGDAGKLITASNAASQAYSIAQAGTTGFTTGYSFDIQNKGAGTVTITPATSTINGASTLVIATNLGCTITSDNTNYQVSACTAAGGGGGSSAFNAITSGNNTTAAMTVGSGASLTPNGGIITANSVAQTQNQQAANYTFVLADANEQIYHTSGTAHTFTIPANSSVAYPIGTVLTLINEVGGGVATVAITTDTLLWSPTGTTGSRSVAATGIAAIVKVTSTSWIITGSGVS